MVKEPCNHADLYLGAELIFFCQCLRNDIDIDQRYAEALIVNSQVDIHRLLIMLSSEAAYISFDFLDRIHSSNWCEGEKSGGAGGCEAGRARCAGGERRVGAEASASSIEMGRGASQCQRSSPRPLNNTLIS